jgi:lambda family phage portal protein
VFGWLGKLFAPQRRTTVSAPRMVRARYDAAQTPANIAKHWGNADNLSADAANAPGIRQTLRSRSRHEVANGAYAKRMVRAKANDLIGTGPHLQMLLKDEKLNAEIEADWAFWMRKARFARALRTIAKAKLQDGEALAVKVTKPDMPTPAKVALRVMECDRLTTPDLWGAEPNRIDGVDLDENGDPIRYHILDQHPGGNSFYSSTARQYPADVVIHWFEEDRPEQHRGIPELTPSLQTFAKHRRFQQATIDSAETAARLAAVIQTENPPSDDAASPEALDLLELPDNAAMVLPEGYKIGQVKAEHPGTVYGEFIDAAIGEEAAPILMPRSIASGDSSKFNYASGRLDHQTYDFGNEIERDDCEIVVVEPVFEDWLKETLAVKHGIAPSEVDMVDWPHEWRWDSRGHVDPAKEASAEQTRLSCGATTLARVYAKAGLDARNELQSQAELLGITLEELQKLVCDKLYGNGNGTTAQPPTPDDVDEDDAEAVAHLASILRARNGRNGHANGRH